MAVRYFELPFYAFKVLIADIFVSTQTGDEALAGRDEKIHILTFPPDSTNERTIWFKGYYLSIYNKETSQYETHIDNANGSPTTAHEKYKVPAGYSVHVRGASVYFEVQEEISSCAPKKRKYRASTLKA